MNTGAIPGVVKGVAILLALLWLSFPWLIPAGQEAQWWGQYTVAFLFFAGVSQFGIVFVSILRLCNARWSLPFYRTAETLTLAGAPLTLLGFLIIYLFGRQHLFYWLAPDADHHSAWLNESLLFWRNLIALLWFYALAWRAITLARRQGEQAARKPLYSLAVWLCAAFIVANTFIAWDFGMMRYPHWHSTVYPIHFFMNSVFGGTAAVLLLTRWLQGRPETAQVRNIGQLFIGFALLWLYFFWAQFVVTWYGNLPQETGPLKMQMEGAYAPLFWAMFVGIFVLPFLGLLSADAKRSPFAIAVLSVLILIAVFLHRYITVMPTLTPVPLFNSSTWLGLFGFAGLFVSLLPFAARLAHRPAAISSD